ncbi:winged helix-turn-helix domain-containing protein [Rhodococcus indonesiensis]
MEILETRNDVVVGAELVLVLRLPAAGAHSPRDLAALADVLREAAQDLVPGVRTHTVLSRSPAPLIIDLPARDVLLDGQRIVLSHSEFEILSYLVRNPRTVVSRAVLCELGTGRREVDSRGRNVDVHVSRIRTELQRFGNIIATVHGSGYRFDPNPAVHVTELWPARCA